MNDLKTPMSRLLRVFRDARDWVLRLLAGYLPRRDDWIFVIDEMVGLGALNA